MRTPLQRLPRNLAPVCVAAAALAAAALPGTATAATITTDGAGTYTYVGAPGEANHMSIQAMEDGGILFYANEGVNVTSAPASCADAYGSGDWSEVVCANPKAIVVQAGDGDENITLSSELPVPVTVDGGPGKDWIRGAEGNDTIVGGPGQDKISGDLAGGDCGPFWCKYPYGNDTIYAQDGEVDAILCGAGTDTVYADAADVVDKNCENVTRAGAVAAAAPAPGGKATNSAGTGSGAKATLVGRVRLAAALKSGFTIKLTGVVARAKVKLSATRSGKRVARGSTKATKNGTATVKLKFTAKAKRTLRHAKSVTLKVGGGGATTTVVLKRR